jgi:hypothetical protein
MYRTAIHITTVGLLLIGSGCDAIDRVRDRGGDEEVVVDTSAVSATAGGFLLAMQMPEALRPGEEGVVRLALTNRSDTVRSGISLDVLMPLWLEPVAPRPGDREVTIVATAEEGLRFSYQMDDPVIEPGQMQTVEQRIRIPLSASTTGGSASRSRIVRARLISPDGQPLVEVASQLTLDTTAGDSIPGDGVAVAVDGDGVGPVQLGMTRAEVQRAAAGARDTAWMQEGMQERGLTVPLAPSGRAMVVLAEDTVTRIEIHESAVRTGEGLGVGSTFQELRTAYGAPCAAVGEGEVVVWFADKPGISFALDAAIPQNVDQISETPDRIAATSRVTHWWVRRGLDDCP